MGSAPWLVPPWPSPSMSTWISPLSRTYTRRSLLNHTYISSQRSLPWLLVLSDLVPSSRLLLRSSTTSSPSSTSSPNSSTSSSPSSLLDTLMDRGRDSATTTLERVWSAGGSSREF